MSAHGSQSSLTRETVFTDIAQFVGHVEEQLRPQEEQPPTNPNVGLTEPEVKLRQLVDGPNELKEDKEKVPVWKKVLTQCMHNIPVLLLLGAGIIAFALEEVAAGVVIIIIMVLNACFTRCMEKSSPDSVAALASMTQPETEVLRDGQTKRIPTRDVVKGDIVNVNIGDVVPADCLLLTSADLKVDEAILTGESVEIAKDHQLSSSDQGEHWEVKTPPNRIFSGTFVTNGRAKCLVIAVGMKTRVGEFVKRLARDDEVEPNCIGVKVKRPTLHRQLHKLDLLISTMALCASMAVFVIGVGRGLKDPENPGDSVVVSMLSAAVALAVSAIPEGLPLCVIVTLTLGSNDMANHCNVLLRQPSSVRTLSSANVICSDTTGTLTKGVMTFAKMYALGGPQDQSNREVNLTSEGLTPAGEFRENGENVMKGEGDPQLKGILESAILNSTAHVKIEDDSFSIRSVREAEMSMDPEDFKEFALRHVWAGEGNYAEVPLIVAGMKAHIFKEKEDEKYPTVGWRACGNEGPEIPFSAARKMMVSVVHTDDGFLGPIELPKGSKYCVLVKGDPNAILKKCEKAMYQDCSFGCFTEQTEKQVNAEVANLSSQGFRIVGFAIKPLQVLPYDPEDSNVDAEDKCGMLVNDVTFAGLMASMYPARDGVDGAIQTARRAGVKTIMITGDYLETAVAIAKNTGLISVNEDLHQVAIDCKSLRPHENDQYLPETGIDAITSPVHVFAGAQPEDKLQIVKSLQRQGMVICMTGAGVNDAPALTEADIGVALGIVGTEFSKGASDMILLDDNFVSIVSAIRKGRQIYSNIRKLLTYLLGANITQVFVYLISVVAGMPVPLYPLAVLVLNMVIGGVPAMSLSTEPQDDAIMDRKPYPRADNVCLNNMVPVC